VKRRLMAITLAIVILAGGAALLMSRATSAAADKATIPTALTAEAKVGTIDVYVKGTSSIAPNEKRTIKATADGKVARILVADGAPVREGETLVSLINETLQNQYQQQKLDLQGLKVQLSAAKAPTEADRATAESLVKTAEANLRARLQDSQKTVVLSPAAGRVASVKANAGDPVSTGLLLATVVDDTDVFAVVGVPQIDISKVRIGQKATVGFGSELPSTEATVYSIGAEATWSGAKATVPVSLRVRNSAGAYRTGMGVNATIFVALGSTGSDQDTIFAGGTVTPSARYEIRSEVEGRIVKVEVKEGDTVAKGQALLALDSTFSEARVAEAEASLKTAREQLARVTSGLAPNLTESDAQALELKVKQAEVALAGRSIDVNALQVKSPIGGTMVAHSVLAGDDVTPGTVLCTVADYGKMTMVIPVDELDVVRVKTGQKASVTVDALPGTSFSAEVTKIATEGTVKDGVANYDVTLTLVETTGLRGAMTATATILVASKDKALLIPAEAVRTTQGQKSVLVLSGEKTETVTVTTGLTNGRVTEVSSGLDEGDVVLLSALNRKRINPVTGQEEPGR